MSSAAASWGESLSAVGGLERGAGLVGGVQCQGQVLEDVGAVGELLAANWRSATAVRRVASGPGGQAAAVAGLGVVRGQLEDLVEPPQGLVGLSAGQLQRGDPQVDRGLRRVELEGAEVCGQGVVGPARQLVDPAQAVMRRGLAGVDLDGQVEVLEGRVQPPARALDLAQADQGADVLGVEPQGVAVLGLGLGEPPLELEDLGRAACGLG